MAYLDTRFGPVALAVDGDKIRALIWGRDGDGGPLVEEGLRQLRAYLDGGRMAFDLPFAFSAGLRGEVQKAMLAIPFGETRTYGDISKLVGAPAQAVGQACGANAIPILVPCHRVLGAQTLGGFSAPGGVETKVALLRHEGAAGLLI